MPWRKQQSGNMCSATLDPRPWPYEVGNPSPLFLSAGEFLRALSQLYNSACPICNTHYCPSDASIGIPSSTLNVSYSEEEISFDADRNRVWPERVRVAAGLLQTQPAQPLLPREGVDPGVRPAPRVIRVSPPGGVLPESPHLRIRGSVGEPASRRLRRWPRGTTRGPPRPSPRTRPGL